MGLNMKHFFVIANPEKDNQLTMANHIQQYIIGHGGTCLVHESIECEQKRGYRYTDPNSVPEDTECVIVLGGDGTMIQAARDLAARDIPLIGVNFGKLGFLTELDQQNITEKLDALLEGRHETEHRMMLSGNVIRNGNSIGSHIALNDIVVNRSGPLRILDFRVYVNGKLLKQYRADGMIAGTPTGSTAYNLSAGGPLVEPKANLILLTPICPHTMNARSIILSAEDVVTVEIGGSQGNTGEPIAAFDGYETIALKPGDRIEIRRSGKTTSVLKLGNLGFLEVLQQKMSDI